MREGGGAYWWDTAVLATIGPVLIDICILRIKCEFNNNCVRR